MQSSRPLTIRAWGPWALFTRPELKVDRVSYEVIPPTAACGIFESILWKPEFKWEVTGIVVVKPVKTVSVMRNEVKNRIPVPSPKTMGLSARDRHPFLNPDDVRTQRRSILLKDVEYRITANILIADDRPATDLAKYVEMFGRRASKGQTFHSPCFGCKEFACETSLVEPTDEMPAPNGGTRPLGLMPYNLWNDDGDFQVSFFQADMTDGLVVVPRAGSPEVFR